MTTALRVAARFSRLLEAAAKTLRVFDFDDTLVSSEGRVTIVKRGGELVSIDSATFAHYTPSVGDRIDFGAFNDVRNPRKIKRNFDRLRQAVASKSHVVILTARAGGASSAVSKFLTHEKIPGVKVVALGTSDPEAKADWIDEAIAQQGYDDVEFFDDSTANAHAVARRASKHTKIKFRSTNTPHPKEDDYEGPSIAKSFKSDNPSHAVVEIKEQPSAARPSTGESSKGHSKWWDDQTPAFKKNYCKEHPGSAYCGGKTAMSDPNSLRKQHVLKRAKATHNVKVVKYVENELFEKMDQAGQMAGIWLETLESQFSALEKKPDGLLKSFVKKDFDDLFTALFGYKR